MKEGMRFSSFEEFKNILKLYREEKSADFSISASGTLDCAKKKFLTDRFQHAPSVLKYHFVKYKCVNGGVFKKRKTCSGLRNTSSMKMNCPANIFLRLSDDGKSLVLEKLVEEHNHEVSPELFKCLPKQRKLDPEDEKEVIRLLELKANKKLVQEKYSALTHKNITLKDLSNLAAKASSKKADFEQIVRNLQLQYKCFVKVLADENNQLKCIYLQDDVMKSDFKKFPEILFADCTYKLTDIRAPVFIMMNENGNGESVVVAAGLFVTEEQGNYKWFVETFKEQNPACENTVTIMTDKDANERTVFREQFPHAKLKICLFHTLQVFNREITTQKMGLHTEELVKIKSIVQNLCYATTVERYDEWYSELQMLSPKHFIEYFDKNWNPIKEEWTGISFFQSATYLNRTNNRVENMNSKLKSVITQFSSLENFFKSFFSVINSNRLERAASAARMFSTKITESFPSPDICDYYNLLTPYSFNLLKDQLEKSKDLGEEKLAFSTETTCVCMFHKSMDLPCKHVFATRRFKKMNMFEKSLVSKRWTKSYFSDTMGTRPVSEPTTLHSITVDVEQLPNTTKLSTAQKFKKALGMTNKLAMIISESPFFKEKMAILQSIYDLWAIGEHNLDIKIKGNNTVIPELQVQTKESTILPCDTVIPDLHVKTKESSVLPCDTVILDLHAEIKESTELPCDAIPDLHVETKEY